MPMACEIDKKSVLMYHTILEMIAYYTHSKLAKIYF